MTVESEDDLAIPVHENLTRTSIYSSSDIYLASISLLTSDSDTTKVNSGRKKGVWTRKQNRRPNYSTSTDTSIQLQGNLIVPPE